MQIPLEITYRNVDKTPEIDDLINQKAARLEKFCPHLISCRVSVEKPQEHRQSGNPYRVRVDLRVPPSHEIVAEGGKQQNEMHEPLHTVIRKAFDAAERQVKDLVAKQRKQVKSHPEQETNAYVSKLFPEEGYGFIYTQDGYEVYFHQNSVLNHDFKRMKVGTGVRYVEEMGEKGPQASTVEIVDKPGVSTFA